METWQHLRLVQSLKHYEQAYKDTVKLISAAPSSEVAERLWTVAKLYQDNVVKIKMELRNV